MKLTRSLPVALALYACVIATVAAAEDNIATESDLNKANTELLMNITRESVLSRVEGRAPHIAGSLPQTLADARNGVHILILSGGRIIGESEARQTTLPGNIRVAAARASANISLNDAKQANIILTILLPAIPLGVTRPVPMLLRKKSALGVHGFDAEYRGMHNFIPPLKPLTENWNWWQTLENLVAPFCRKDNQQAQTGKKNEHTKMLKMLSSNPDLKVSLVPGYSVASLPGENECAIVYRMDKPISVKSVSPNALENSLAKCRQWISVNQREDGLFNESVAGGDKGTAKDARLMDQALMGVAIGDLWRKSGDMALHEAGKKLLATLIKNHYREDARTGAGYMREGREVSLGAAAATLLAIFRLEADKDSDEYKKHAEKLAAFIASMKNTQGRFMPYFQPAGRETNEGEFAGLAMLALLEWAQNRKDASTPQGLLPVFRYYQKNASEFSPEEFIPWHIAASIKLYNATRMQEVADNVLRLAELAASIQQVYAFNNAFIANDIKGSFLEAKKRITLEPQVGTSAPLSGAMSQAAAFARQLGEDKTAARYAESAIWGTRFILQSQIADEFDILLMQSPAQALGGFRKNPCKQETTAPGMHASIRAMTEMLDNFPKKFWELPKTLQ